ncbi:phospholipase A2 inhibitor-like [Acanthaster planci]|uniref:Phospholipase A2 inhibitor-like n=1 Tax=Acanthaster planci TaxID=133434 RepID=A0A8B7XU57_ACAPL|nr:phospholipase A2 inhibitor-like [Acanthaster planci]
MASNVISSLLLICAIINTNVVHASQDASCYVTCEYTAWALDANCRNRGLTEVPLECSQSEMVDLRNNDLTYLGPGSFAGYRSLRYVDLEFNQISNIANGAFEECISLQNIYLQFNSLYEVTGRAFEGASDLKQLFLNQNSITYMHPDAFVGLDKLSGLYIGHNDISNLHALVFRNTPLLKYLHMGDNGLMAFPAGIFDVLTELTYMNIENNNLRSIDGSLFESLENLEELNLSGNLIVSITNFPLLAKFKIFDLFDNDLRDIDDLAAKINGLDQLYLAKNDNLNCTCSVDPIRVWVTNHLTDEGVDILKANVTCGWPQHLRGYALSHLTRSSLCPALVSFGFTGIQPFTQTTTVQSLGSSSSNLPLATEQNTQPSTQIASKQGFEGSDYDLPLVTEQNAQISSQTNSKDGFDGKDQNLPVLEQNVPGNSELDPVTLYSIVGAATLFSVVFVLIVLMKYLNWYTRTYHQRQQQAQTCKSLPRPITQRQQERSLPMVPMAPTRQIQEDEGAYETVIQRSHFASDSDFEVQDDVSTVDEAEAQIWFEQTYEVPTSDSDDSNEFGHPDPPYVAVPRDIPGQTPECTPHHYATTIL